MDKMRFFYKTQLARLTNMVRSKLFSLDYIVLIVDGNYYFQGQEAVNFSDVTCQMMDMICPENSECITMADLLKPTKMHLSGTISSSSFSVT